MICCLSRFKILSPIVQVLMFACTFLLCHADDSNAAAYFYSFENGMQGWSIDATDLKIGDGVIDWDIERSTDRAFNGVYSLKYYLENLNDQGKIWIEKPFYVQPNRTYRVMIGFKLASSINSPVGAFRIIAGVSNLNPEEAQDLAFQGDTNNGGKVGYVWLPKNYSFIVTSSESGVLYVSVGIWGNWEVAHTYYFDMVNITIQQQ